MIVQTVSIYVINFSNKISLSFLSNEALNIGEYVIAETSRGIELGIVSSGPKPYIPVGEEALTFIIRKADEKDLELYKNNIEEASKILVEVQKQCDKLKLEMKIISSEFTLDKTKLMLSYVSDERVDFRELLKVLASMYHTRIELKQIGPRDKAKLCGGIGICGLPLCCNVFLNEFDGITITMAKNQMLALNIPKLSGQCGKLMCCLKYENELYSNLKENYPRVGLKIKYKDSIYRIASINVITGSIRLDSPNNIINVSLEDIKDSLNNITFEKK